MELIKTTSKKEHWLMPFKDKIISIEQLFDDTIEIVIKLTKDELKMYIEPETLRALGIKTISVETPVKEIHINQIPDLKHTGERLITLSLNPQKANNEKSLQIKPSVTSLNYL